MDKFLNFIYLGVPRAFFNKYNPKLFKKNISEYFAIFVLLLKLVKLLNFEKNNDQVIQYQN